MKFLGADIISVNQFDAPDITQIFSLAERLRPYARGEKPCDILRGKILGNLFLEASTRSRMSFATAWMRLGGQVNGTTGMTFSSMSKGETLEDTIQVVQEYCDLIAIRHPDLGSAMAAANVARIPVINAGDGPGEHPTQALLDLFTIQQERGSLDGLTVAMAGDLKFGRTAHSLAKLLALYPTTRFVFIAPPDISMPQELVTELHTKGCDVTQTIRFDEFLPQADVIYMTRMQEERFATRAEFEKVNGIYVLDRHTVETTCKNGATILHPLPRTNEVSRDVDPLPNAAYFRQAANGIAVRMALYLLLLGKEGELG